MFRFSALDAITTDMQLRMESTFLKDVRSHFHNRRRIRSYTASLDKALALFNVSHGSVILAQLSIELTFLVDR